MEEHVVAFELSEVNAIDIALLIIDSIWVVVEQSDFTLDKVFLSFDWLVILIQDVLLKLKLNGEAFLCDLKLAGVVLKEAYQFRHDECPILL